MLTFEREASGRRRIWINVGSSENYDQWLNLVRRIRDKEHSGKNEVSTHPMYGMLAGTWYLEPGSKSISDRRTGGLTPLRRSLEKESYHKYCRLIIS